MGDHTRKLLDMNDSNSTIAWFVRSRLNEIESFLEEASTKFPHDPGAEISDAVRQEFRNISQPTTPAIIKSQMKEKLVYINLPTQYSNSKDIKESTPHDSVTSTDEFKLYHLKNTFESDPELCRYLGEEFKLKSETDSDLWNEIQRKLLRLPKKIAISWKEKAVKLAEKAGAKIDNNKSNMKQLPFIDNEDHKKPEVIYPGLKENIQTKGLGLYKNVSLDFEFLKGIKTENLSDDLNLLSRLVCTCITFIDLEPDLHHALETVYKFDTIHLHSNPEQREKYITALTQRFQRTLKAEKNSDEDPLSFLKAWIAVDEAIHSLVFIPPVDSNSWWGELQKQSRPMLWKIAKEAQEKGHDVGIQELSGLYASIRKLSSKNSDLELEVGGIPREVQTCLRVYARIDKQELPGRVIFRSK